MGLKKKINKTKEKGCDNKCVTRMNFECMATVCPAIFYEEPLDEITATVCLSEFCNWVHKRIHDISVTVYKNCEFKLEHNNSWLELRQLCA